MATLPIFGVGFRIRLLADDGQHITAERIVQAFDTENGRLVFDSPLSPAPAGGTCYELRSELQPPVLCIRYLLACPRSQPLPPVSVRLGTTRGTNALLTRTGAKVGFVTTVGFGDILRIGNQDRPELFRLDIRKHAPLFNHVVEINERIDADGNVLTAPDDSMVGSQLKSILDAGCESLAICLLNSYRNSTHEQQVARIARDVGFREISISSQTSPLIKLIPRSDTTVLDAYLNPILRSYVEDMLHSLHKDSSIRMLTSAGGLVSPELFTGKESVLSGPAGGVVGFSSIAKAVGFDRAIGFDMGGTSTDVSRFDGKFDIEYEHEKAGVRIATPMLAIETVAAGGGSICSFDDVKLTVGPGSAGAEPGPACYGRGGPLTVTDVNLFLGRILPEQFPFGLDLVAVKRRLDELATRIGRATGTFYSRATLADGYRQIANANMTGAIRSISIAKGCDPSDYVLVPFGGAAGQHACAVADELGIDIIVDHVDAGVLSARGAGQATIMRHGVLGIYRRLDDVSKSFLDATFSKLEANVVERLCIEGVSPSLIQTTRLLQLRYVGLEQSMTIGFPADHDFGAAYESEHLKLFGFTYKDRPMEIVAARVEAAGNVAARIEPITTSDRRTRRASATRNSTQGEEQADVYRREELLPGDSIVGPSIVANRFSTTFIEHGWTAETLSDGTLLLKRALRKIATNLTESETNGPTRPKGEARTKSDPITLELFNCRFRSVAEQMGKTLQKTSSSVNVKERLDFSCAIFTSDGDLVVNAPHIPVHLGAMSETVKHVIQDHPNLNEGDVIITNHPFKGGSHLPDITVITPVFGIDRDQQSRIRFFTANRAHHAEIGGITPGSMPAFSKNLSEEGVLISSFKLVEAGSTQLEKLRKLLLAGEHPTRSIADNLSDVTAQIASNQSGAVALKNMIAQYSWHVVSAYMQHIQRAAENKTRAAIQRLPDGDYQFTDYLDDDSPIIVQVRIRGQTATIDFNGTGPVLANNLNANPAIVTSATLYCFRCLIDEDIPLNQGVLAPVELVLPDCLLNPRYEADPAKCPAVVGGNVETSQRVVDTILGALRIAAGSQGTMNNLIFGDSSFGYYETICGGAGATRDWPGADAVHTHMTNTRLTDPELLESRYPVRLIRFQIRRGSGGRGQQRGGDGVIRCIEFLRPLQVSILSQRRGKYRPYGLDGGLPGSAGHNFLTKVDGSTIELGGVANFHVDTGDMLTIETPGGGASGVPGKRRN